MSETREVYLDRMDNLPVQVQASIAIVPVEQAHRIARELKQIIEDCQLAVSIGASKHVRHEGWLILCALLNIAPPTIVELERIEIVIDDYEPIRRAIYAHIEEAIKVDNWQRVDQLTRRLQQYPIKRYVAYRAVAEMQIGDRVFRAQAMCSNQEANWRNRDEYAIMSMAQTRASGKCARLPLGWIMPLAGYNPTPYEEMEGAEQAQRMEHPEPEPHPRRRARQPEAQANGDAEKQQLIDSVGALWRELYPADDQSTREAFRLILQQRYQAERLSQLTIDQLREFKAQLEADREGETLT